jgi:alkanesulfonate monooxygenase SsuD/methylene tetrahydromethanopterin reductase-like flavin-dependent oxidoreductase (luciferase family)
VRFTYAEAMTDPTFYVPLAKAAEAAGYASMTVPDSIAYPFESDSTYPYTPMAAGSFSKTRLSSRRSCSPPRWAW